MLILPHTTRYVHAFPCGTDTLLLWIRSPHVRSLDDYRLRLMILRTFTLHLGFWTFDVCLFHTHYGSAFWTFYARTHYTFTFTLLRFTLFTFPFVTVHRTIFLYHTTRCSFVTGCLRYVRVTFHHLRSSSLPHTVTFRLLRFWFTADFVDFRLRCTILPIYVDVLRSFRYGWLR